MIKLFTKKSVLAGIAVIAIGGSIFYYSRSNNSAPDLITTRRGDISEEVIVTGNTRPVQEISLAFQVSGKIARVNVGVGDKVAAGEALVELDTSELAARLREVEASVAAAQAKLDALKRGTRLEDIQITRTQLDKAEQDLTNDYNGVLAILNDAYAKADDSVRNQLSAFFTNADAINPQLTFSTNDSQIQTDVQAGRVIVGAELTTWKTELVALNSTSENSREKLDQALNNAQSHLGSILTFLAKTSDALVGSLSLGASTLTTYKTNVTTAKSALNTAITNVNNSAETIASQKLTVQQQSDQLALQLAGTTAEDIRAQEAAVAQTKASAAVTQAQLNQTAIRSPMSGTVTRQDAKVGQIATANNTLISVISADNLEVNANIPEVDIGKIAIADNVYITLDAFPGELFAGKVVKIDPAETVVDGVVNFKVTINFDSLDSRVKSGLTANLRIETKKKIDVLILPQIAILQNDQGTFVNKYENGEVKEMRVELGVRDESGNVEIVSGVIEGDQVMNVGLKTQ
ncbi:MAG: efflux RND transporter periplasmic adaptor subunit [bacterium]|nr:efflux RND transporter periplasmic adaptor subunit [bacterium]